MRTVIRLLAVSAAMLGMATPGGADGLRDPMRPAGVAPAARPLPVHSLKLEGVITGATRVAIVNGRLVRGGDMVSGARILEVLPNGVRYERAGKTLTLTLPTARSTATVRVARSAKQEAPE